MTYFGFHLRFNLPVLILAGWGAGCGLIAPGSWEMVLGILAIVMVFTSPWDNWAAYCGIWGFPEGRYWKRIGWLPFEEYLFFVVQALQAMLLTRWALDLWGPFTTPAHPLGWVGQGWVCAGILAAWAVVGLCFRGRFGRASRGHYAWHLFFWFIPVILIQWVVGGPVLAARWPVLAAVTLVLGTYLSLADLVAIRHGVWHFDEKQTTGWKIGPKMPWEEAAFFYLTSALVAQSYLILLPEALR
ncbi:MAG: lycopene cyclase domain-containing protein [Candidatus Methylacidiphilales bacterium]|nr:lycopene cyclase domain-containing protein [Candidatus Methylacidiphilales bacterium]